MLRMEFIQSQRNGKLLAINGYCYRTKGTNKNTGKEYFQCIEPNCRVRVSVLNGHHDHSEEHLHEDHFIIINQKKFKSDLKEEVSTSLKA